MKLLAIHADYLKFQPTKKALKNAEEVDEKETVVKECLVFLTSVEKKDESYAKEVTERLVAEAKDIAQQVKAQTLVIYPYAHLSSELANPAIAVQILDDAKRLLEQEKYTVIRAPFGWYKSFEWRCKGHPLAELSRSIDLSQPGAVVKKNVALKPKALELDLQHNNPLQNTGAFILAWAVHELFPKAIPILALSEQGAFTVDFTNVKFSHTDLQKIGKKMDDFVQKNYAIKEGTVKAEHPFQNELLQGYKKEVKAYSYGNYTMLIPGSVMLTSGGVKAFSLENISGSYWKGDNNNQMLQRITGHAFKSEQDLKEFLEQLATAQQRDHRIIGQAQKLFFLDETVGKGLPLWLPRGTIIRDAVEQFALALERQAGYHRVVTPHLAKEQLYITSGHLPYYKDNMYPPMVMDDGTYYLRGMNCPHHHMIYLHELRSYRDLPLRLAEYGTVYRNELSGTLAGLLRVRGMSMNDAHIYCRKDQIKQEVKGVMELIMHYFKVFGLKNYWFRLSKWSKQHTEKYVNQPENWEYSQQVIREVLQEMRVPFTEADDEATFYGPKIDIQFTSAIGREETMSTIQLDFLAKERFGLFYFDVTGKKNNEVFVIHRAPLSTHERFTAFLIEHYAGKFPLWLSPVQAKLITVADKHVPFAKEVYQQLFDAGIRVELNDKPETLPKKVRDAEVEKVNYIITIGDKEVEKKTLAVRSRGGKVQFGVAALAFIKDLQEKISKRLLDE